MGALYRLTRGTFPEDMPDMARFDVVTMLAVLEGLPAVQHAPMIAACGRWLEPGGRLIFTAPPESADLLPAEEGTRKGAFSDTGASGEGHFTPAPPGSRVWGHYSGPFLARIILNTFCSLT